ncbi:MAG: hypothetical protein ACM30E_05305 [Nitrososphaerales archaeon]
MQTSRSLTVLTVLIALLAVVVTAVAGFSSGGPGPSTIATIHGTTAPIYGYGLYQKDSLLIGSGFRGNDAVMLFVATPLLLVSFYFHRRGSLKASILLLGALATFLYAYWSLAFGAMYNALFPLYILLFSLSFFAFVLAFTSLDIPALAGHVLPALPHRALAAFLFVCAAVLFIVWFLMTLLPSILSGNPPQELAHYTTLITHALDLGIIMPALLLAGPLLLRRRAFGYALGGLLFVMAWLLGLSISAGTLAQVLAGYPYTPGTMISFGIPFVVLALGGIWANLTFFHHIR